MAELHLTVPYRKKQMRPVLWLAYAVFPVWSMIAPALLGLFVISLFQGLSIPTLWTVSIVLILLGMFLSGMLYSAFAEDKTIHITKEGLSFPLFLLQKLKLRRHRNWEELSKLDLIETSQDKYLILEFGQGNKLDLSCSSIKEEQLEEMLLAIELWGKQCERSAGLVRYQKEIQSKNTESNKVGYTQLWEEELSRRFHATTFIPLEPGKTLQNESLKVERQMAFGGLSAIYLVQKNSQDLYVLKEAVVPDDVDKEAKAQAEAMLQRESKMLFSVSHPHIANVVDYFVEEDRHYLLLEYINGQDLRQLVGQNGAQREAIVVSWGIQIAGALDYLHSLDPPIVHRDLTPDNIVLRENGNLVIIDFGAANEFVGTATGTLIGKQAYIAPEQLRGKAALQSDLYALGGTLFFLLTGRDPTPLAQPELKQILPEANDELNELLKDLTTFEKSDRIQTAKETIERLNGVFKAVKQKETANES